MRNALITAFALARCDHRGSIEQLTTDGRAVLLCQHCGACSVPTETHDATTRVRWRRPHLVMRLERDLDDELPILVLDLEDAERASEEIAGSLAGARELAESGNPVDRQTLATIADAARAWSSAVAKLRLRFLGFGQR